MTPTWHRISATLFDRDHKPGTITIFFEYNLGNWVFGWRLDQATCWYDLSIEIGPFRVSFNYWRVWPTDTGSVT